MRYPCPTEALFYDVLLESDRLIRRVFPTKDGDFQRGGLFAAAASIVAIREAADEESDEMTVARCPFCRQSMQPDHR